jgi:hypothetical protein
VEQVLFDATCVDHKDDAVNRDGGLGNIRGDDDLAVGRGVIECRLMMVLLATRSVSAVGATASNRGAAIRSVIKRTAILDDQGGCAPAWIIATGGQIVRRRRRSSQQVRHELPRRQEHTLLVLQRQRAVKRQDDRAAEKGRRRRGNGGAELVRDPLLGLLNLRLAGEEDQDVAVRSGLLLVQRHGGLDGVGNKVLLR